MHFRSTVIGWPEGTRAGSVAPVGLVSLARVPLLVFSSRDALSIHDVRLARREARLRSAELAGERPGRDEGAAAVVLLER